MRVGFVYDDVYLEHENPPGHPECADRLKAIMTTMRSSEVWNTLIQIPPRKASTDDLLRIHTAEHIEDMRTLAGYADPDTYVSKGSFNAALYAAGALLEAIDRIKAGEVDAAFCAVRPPGHHAEANRAMGFCLFNNVAVGARYAQQCGLRKVFIVDFDVHHGNGTQHSFYNDPTVFYFSTHQSPHYPGTGAEHETGSGEAQGTTMNFPFPHGTGNREYTHIYQDILPGLIRDFDPDIVLVSAGYDLIARDPLAGLRITEEGIEIIVRGILSGKGVPCVFTLEGGYDLQGLSASVLVTVKTLLSHTAQS